jgi:hypothetical protein
MAPSHLLIMACPYCGSSDVHELNRIEGHAVESVAVCCLSCDEECSIDRNLDVNTEDTEDND